MAPRTKRTPVRAKRFLAALSSGVSVAAAAAEAGFNRAFAYKWRAADPDFAARWQAAYEEGTDTLEDEARRRAVQGVETPVYYGGKEIGKIQKHSDTLLMFLLRGRRPGKYNWRLIPDYANAGILVGTASAALSDTERAQEVLRVLARGKANNAGLLEHRKDEETQ